MYIWEIFENCQLNTTELENYSDPYVFFDIMNRKDLVAGTVVGTYFSVHYIFCSRNYFTI